MWVTNELRLELVTLPQVRPIVVLSLDPLAEA